MKSIISTIILTLSIFQLNAQSKEHRIAKTSGQVVITGLDEIVVEGYSGNEVILSTDDFDSEVDERASGLRLVNSLGLEDNSGLGLHVEEKDNDLIVTQISSSCDGDFVIKVPFGMGIDYVHRTNSGGDIVIKDIKEEIVINTTYGDVELHNITGPMAVKTVYGYIEAKFTEVAQEGSISLESVYDFIDVSVPSNTKANIKLSTPYGEIYSNVDIDVKTDNGMRKVSNTHIQGTTNGGGVDFNIRASYENIYLRKK